MATVTGYTAARMKQIEDETVVNAYLDGDDLVFKTREGTTINVGSVRGPKGDDGNAGDLDDYVKKTALDSRVEYQLPEEAKMLEAFEDIDVIYDAGYYMQSVGGTSGNGYPSTNGGTLLVYNMGATTYEVTQVYLTAPSYAPYKSELFFRSCQPNGGWGPWQRSLTESDLTPVFYAQSRIADKASMVSGWQTLSTPSSTWITMGDYGSSMTAAGIFYAPVTGVYHIHADCFSDSTKVGKSRFILQISQNSRHNNDFAARFESQTTTKGQFIGGSVDVEWYLTQNQDVYVDLYVNAGFVGVGLTGGTFSARLVM